MDQLHSAHVGSLTEVVQSRKNAGGYVAEVNKHEEAHG